MQRNNHSLGNPVFLMAVVILLLNDFIWKYTFSNDLTGKLSDFTGLFAFPFFFSALWPRHRMAIHVFTAIFFIYWKSGASGPLILLCQSVKLPIQRTVDVTDNMALVSIVLSYHSGNKTYSIPVFARKIVMVITCFAFMATSRLQHTATDFVSINKSYVFDCNRKNFISVFNSVQMKEIAKYNSGMGIIQFNAEDNIFHTPGKKDTLARMLDYEKVKNQDTIFYNTSYASLLITGSDRNVAVTVLRIRADVPRGYTKDFRDKAIKTFEKRVIRKLRKSIPKEFI